MYSGQTRPVTDYDRQIRYLDYMENGLRSKGAGFVKLERRDGLCSISLQISGLYRKDHFVRPLFLLRRDGECELCRLQLADGGIKTYLEGLDSHNLAGQGLDYEQLTGLRIPISEGKEICCLWGKTMAAERESAESPENERGMRDTYSPERSGTERETRDAYSPERSGTERETRDAYSPERTEERRELCGLRNGKEMMGLDSPQRTAMHQMSVEKAAQGWNAGEQEQDVTKPSETILREDKWEQLYSLYPHISPFSDEREYLSLGPEDFVILHGHSYKLVSNSFLLHGYYNYHHLILTRISQRNNARYYIGVPGVYYEREKKIAILFGFESFECAAEPAKEGDFGYYMIQVEL